MMPFINRWNSLEHTYQYHLYPEVHHNNYPLDMEPSADKEHFNYLPVEFTAYLKQ